MPSPFRVEIAEAWGEGETALGALVACMLDIEGIEKNRLLIEAEAERLGLDMAVVWPEYRLAAAEIEKKDDCPHDELEFDGNCEVQRDSLVFHVNCRKCGRSGSTTVTAEEVLW